MSLPTEMALRRVVSTGITYDGTPDGKPVDGLVTYQAEVRELIVGGVSVYTGVPITGQVTNGTLSVDLIAGDDPDVESGLGRPFAWKVTRAWDTRHPFYIVVPSGPTGVAADDDPINETTLHVPNPPAGVAIIKGPKGDPGSGGGAVDSVAGKTGVVNLVKSDVGLSSVDNTSDADKPVSTAQAMALDARVATVNGVGPDGSGDVTVASGGSTRLRATNGAWPTLDSRTANSPNQDWLSVTPGDPFPPIDATHAIDGDLLYVIEP